MDLKKGDFFGILLRRIRNILTFAAKKGNTMSRTTTVSLGPHYEDFIRNIILQGRYNNASEVIREGLRRLEEDETRLAALRAAIQEGIDSGDCENFDPEAFLQELKAKRHRNG